MSNISIRPWPLVASLNLHLVITNMAPVLLQFAILDKMKHLHHGVVSGDLSDLHKSLHQDLVWLCSLAGVGTQKPYSVCEKQYLFRPISKISVMKCDNEQLVI